MLPPHLRSCLSALRDALESAFGERLRDVVLFGSYARGDATEDSDVDVLVLVRGLEQPEVASIADAATQVSLSYGVPVAALPLSAERFEELRREGRALAQDIERHGARV